MMESALGAGERLFRATAKYVHSKNQTKLGRWMDPIYDRVARHLLKGSSGPSERLARRQFPANLYFDYRKRSRKLEYYIEDWDFSEARPELLTPRQRMMMHTVALGETSGAAVGDGFLRAFRTEPELAAFFGTWFVEELNHFLGYHLYLERMGERWPAARAMDVAEVDFRPYAESAGEIAACNMYQELVGYLVYRSLSTQVRDPFLAKMLDRFAKDELRHYKFYQAYVAREIQRDPDFRFTVMKVILKTPSPYNQVSGGTAQVLDHIESGAHYFRKREFDFFVREVEYLVGKDLTEFFSWFFRGACPPCARCGRCPYACACERFDDDAVPKRRRPTWWQQTRRRESGLAIFAEVWADELKKIASSDAGGTRANTRPADASAHGPS